MRAMACKEELWDRYERYDFNSDESGSWAGTLVKVRKKVHKQRGDYG